MCVLAYAFSFFMVVDLLIILFIINYFINIAEIRCDFIYLRHETFK